MLRKMLATHLPYIRKNTANLGNGLLASHL